MGKWNFSGPSYSGMEHGRHILWVPYLHFPIRMDVSHIISVTYVCFYVTPLISHSVEVISQAATGSRA